MISSRRGVGIVSCASLLLSTQAFAGGWVEWPIKDGGNGHLYRLTDILGTWDVAEAEAEACGGHLVTINDAAENQWVFATFGQGPNVWIGFHQDLRDPNYSEPAGAWKWISGELATYTNWVSGEPNDNGGENWAEMKGVQSTWPGQWNDQVPGLMLRGVIELGCNESATCPWDCGDSDNDAGVVDLLALLSEWGLACTPCDFDGAGVGVTDLLDLLGHWGPCP